MELRLAIRALMRRAGVSAAIVITIGLSVAITSALFAIVDGLLFRPLPFDEPTQLVAIDFRSSSGRRPEVAYQKHLAWRRHELRTAIEQSPLFRQSSQAGFATFFSPDEMRAWSVEAHGVDSRFFKLLGVNPLIGDGFTEADERSVAVTDRTSSTPLPVIIGNELWHRLYGADPRVLGVHQLAGRTVRIVAVMPPGIKFPGETNVWAPVAASRDRPPAFARLADGVNAERVRTLFTELEIRPLTNAIRPEDSRSMIGLLCAAALLVLITWIQVAGLMFASATGQLPQIGIRLAMGCSRRRIALQQLFETVLLATAALASACIVLRPLTAFIIKVLPDEVRRGQYLDPSWRTFTFAVLLSVLGLVFLNAVTLRIIRRVSPLGLLANRFDNAPVRPERMRHGLLAMQMTLTAALLYLAALTAHSYFRAATLDYGFDAAHVLLFTPPPWARLNTTRGQLQNDFAIRNSKLKESVAVLNDLKVVRSASTFMTVPLRIGVQPELTQISYLGGRPLFGVHAREISVGPAFAATLGVVVLAGHSFDDPLYSNRPDVALVNETLARRLLPNVADRTNELLPSIIGREIRSAFFRGQVIGLIKDLVDKAPGIPAEPQFFTPDLQSGAASVIGIRTRGATDAAMPSIRDSLENVWGELTPQRFGLLTDELRRVLLPYRAQSTLIGAIAALCLPTAIVGLVGAISYSVQRRRRDLAIRLAMGASHNVIQNQVIWQSLVVIAIGLIAGFGLGALIASLITHRLYGVRPLDWPTIAVVSAGFLAVAWCSALIPVRRLVKLDPAVALREG